ncbi:MAG: ATP-binding protein [Pseudomonadota bacterium]
MREFNTCGPCDPSQHYTVIREALIAEGQAKVAKGRYFTLFAPRQAGKTTFFQQLLRKLTDSYTPIWISLENLKTVSKNDFYQELNHELRRELAKQGIPAEITIRDPISLTHFFEQPQSKPIVLVIDEFEGLPDAVLNELMHTFRKIYHQKESYSLHSLILVGVTTVAELVLSSASPFNIAEEMQLPYFTVAEVRSLLQQYFAESQQSFTDQAIQAIYDNTKGQPGLVCALCSYLVEKLVTNRSQPVTIEHYYQAQHHFLTERFDKNIINIVQKAREKRAFMLRLLFNEEPLSFSIHDPDLAWLYANGVIDKDNGNTDIMVPLYKKVLITAFRPLINGESQYYLNSPSDTVNKYLTPDMHLNINELLHEYRAYIRRRGFRAFDTEHLKEAAWHYSLDGFINFFIQCLGGETFVEVPSGRGRTDILIWHNQQRYIIETKRFVNHYYFQQGKGQLVEYLNSEALNEGYYVVFSNQHPDQLYSEEIIQGKQIYTHIIPTKFETPSRVAVPDELKLSQAEQIASKMLQQGFSTEQIAQLTGINGARIEQLNK